MATKITSLLDRQTAKADPLHRLHQIVRLVQLRDQGRLPLPVLRALDEILVDHEQEDHEQ